MSTSVAPRSRSTPRAASNARRTVSSTPSETKALGTPTRTPAIVPESADVKSGTGSVEDVESIGSLPGRTESASAASPTVRVNGPIWSSDEANARSPYRDTRPYVGLSPTTPQNEAGWRMEPPVSDPNDSGTHADATAAAEPPLEPPGVRSAAHGLRTGPYAEFSFDEPIANSSQFALATITAPAAPRRSVTVASYGGTNVSRILDEAVVRRPRTHMLSFRTTGTPASGPSDAPEARARSICSARAIARSLAIRLNALSAGF